VSDSTSTGAAILRHAESRPDSLAVVATGFEPLSYRDLRDYVARIAVRLRESGLDRSARVAVALPSGGDGALAIVATACAAVAVPIDTQLTAPEIDGRLARLRPRAVIVPGDGPSATRDVAMGRGLAVIEANSEGPGKLGMNLSATDVGPVAAVEEPDDAAIAFILQTSGTTAEPKLIPFSHGNMLAAAARVQSWFGLTPADRCLSVSPVCYSHGLKVTVFTPLITGGSVAFPRSPSSLDVDEWLGALGPTWYSAGPTLHRYMLDKTKPLSNVRSIHSLRFVVSGGAPLSREVREGLSVTLGVPVLEHYGSSEAAQISANMPPPGPAKPGTCGIPAKGTVKIVAENGSELPAGEHGEILLGGPTVTSGYLDAAELNCAAFVDGWFRTGDTGSLDADGFLILHGRKTELINRGGEKISPPEIDDALQRHPLVAEAAAFAMPHTGLGEDVAAAVVLKEGASVTALKLREFLLPSLALFKIPRRIVFVDRLPKGTTGKVQRQRLVELLETRSEPFVGASDRLHSALLRIWSRLLETSDLSIDDDFFDKGGDSLRATQLMLELRQLTGKAIPDTLLFESSTIRALVQRLSEKETPRAKAAVRIGAASDGGAPLLFFHGDWTTGGFYLEHLARKLGPEVSLIAVSPHGIGDEPIPRSIEDMAADRLPAILNAQPKGPYRLAGHCVGGIVALETARLLIALDHKVEAVVMVDSPLMIAGEVSTYREAASGSEDARSHGLVAASDDIPIIPDNFEDDSPEVWERYGECLARYSPAPLAAPLLIFASEFDGRPWSRLSENAELLESRGGHFDWVTGRIDVLSDRLRSWLRSNRQDASDDRGRAPQLATKATGHRAGPKEIESQ
jgi:acyl-CoA synthetase (AMP-forming)/AMP-acid ligase II/pimeloyl-ACP methyl ester carboxylesterase/acyl carrier protein